MFTTLLMLTIAQQPKFVKAEQIMDYVSKLENGTSCLLTNLNNVSKQEIINQHKPTLQKYLTEFQDKAAEFYDYQRKRCKFDTVYSQYHPLEVKPDVEKTMSELAILGERMTTYSLEVQDAVTRDHAQVASQLFGNNRGGTSNTVVFYNEFYKVWSNREKTSLNFVNDNLVASGKSVKINITKGRYNVELMHFAVPPMEEKYFVQSVFTKSKDGSNPIQKKPRATVDLASYVKEVDFDLPFSNAQNGFISYLVVRTHGGDYTTHSYDKMLLPVDALNGNAPFWSPKKQQNALFKMPYKMKKDNPEIINLELVTVPDSTGMLSNLELVVRK